MAVDQQGVLNRLKSVLPQSWFPSDSPVLDGVLSGFAYVGAFASGLVDYARLQTRIATSTDFWLDLTAFDYFGLRFKRRKGQGDDSFRAAIIAEVLRPRATRAGMVRALTDLTGTSPVIFEPANIRDTGAYGHRMGYGFAGRYGSLSRPNEVLVDVRRPLGAGIPAVAGYSTPRGAYGGGRSRFSSLSEIAGPVTDADILATVEDTKPVGTRCWVAISTAWPSPNQRSQYVYLLTPDGHRLVSDTGQGILLAGPPVE